MSLHIRVRLRRIKALAGGAALLALCLAAPALAAVETNPESLDRHPEQTWVLVTGDADEAPALPARPAQFPEPPKPSLPPPGNVVEAVSGLTYDAVCELRELLDRIAEPMEPRQRRYGERGRVRFANGTLIQARISLRVDWSNHRRRCAAGALPRLVEQPKHGSISKTDQAALFETGSQIFWDDA